MLGVTAGVLLWRLILIERRGARIDAKVGSVYSLVTRWQATHDNQVASMDRRMRDVEAASARSAREAQILSMQLVGPDGLARRVERLEAWVMHLAERDG
jgi:hypothetical protein